MSATEHVAQPSSNGAHVVIAFPTARQIFRQTRIRFAFGRPLLDVVADERFAGISGVGLGVRVNGVDLGDGSELLRTTASVVRGSWNARSGKATGPYAYEHREIVHELRHESGMEWQVHVREATDGIAVRYALAELQGHARLEEDRTRVPLDGFERAWVLDYQTWYETPRVGIELPVTSAEVGFPVLLRGASDEFALLTESAIDGRFSGSHLLLDAERGAFVLADPATEITRGIVTPWRVIVMGSLADIVETRLIDELAPEAPAELADAQWVRPGRAAWSWWSAFYSGAQFAHQRRFVDAAADLGWEHLLIDCGWDAVWVPEIVAYASERGIQVHLWTVWHDLDGPEGLARLALWRSWGIAGIKVDFMESESKDRYRWYDSVIAETARLGLMVNFHGSVIPRGWARTWPHVIGYEAIRGSEYYVFYQGMPLTAAHNVIQPFTRNAVGAMDYTPVAFSAPDRQTSDAHELALAIVYECGITHFADDVDVYRARPEAATLLAELAPAWDESILVAGTPDTEAVIARRSGDRWFVGGIATGAARRLIVPLGRLGAGTWQAWTVRDAAGGGLSAELSDTRDALIVEIADNGGFATILAPAGTELFRAQARERREPVFASPAVQMLSADGEAEIEVEPGARLRLAPGWTSTRITGTRTRVRAPDSLRSGEVGVVTVERPGTDVAVVGNARLVAPLTPGEHVLSRLEMIAFDNEDGPVERNLSNGGGNPADGRRMQIAGVGHDVGYGVSTPSRIAIHLGGGAARLSVDVGVDDETPDASAVARVVGDGIELATVQLAGGDVAARLVVDLTGVALLELVTEPLTAGGPPAHVDWASGRVDAASAAPGASVEKETSGRR